MMEAETVTETSELFSVMTWLMAKEGSIVRFEVFKAVKIQFEVFWVATLCSNVAKYQRFGGHCCLYLQVVIPRSHVVGYQCFGGPYCLQLHPEDGGNTFLRNIGILTQQYTVSQTRRPRLGFHYRWFII